MDIDDIMEPYEYKLPKRKRENNMKVIRTKRTILGRTEDNTGVPVKNAKVIPANQEIIDAANAELRKKCASQKANDAEAAVAAREMIAGPCDDEKGKTLTKKL